MRLCWNLLPAAFVAALLPASSGRITASLDGIWEVAESVGADDMPTAFRHAVPVPGLVSLASPAFPDAGRFESAEWIDGRIRLKLLEPGAAIKTRGISGQRRNYFWYRTRFRPSLIRQIALLRIGKAQFGTAVWLNGKKIGDHLGCFTAGFFNLTDAIDWRNENTLLVRLGAHPAAVPATVPTGTDPSKKLWLPGIYDSVSLILADNPVIETVQVAPRIRSSEIVIQTQIRNYGGRRTLSLHHKVRSGPSITERIELKEGEFRSVRHVLKIASPILWSPERPHLYELSTRTGGDEVVTRFGMRELRFDTATRRAYLNGKPYFFRGSNIALHRFFEDPQAGRLPWNREWVRKVMGEIPKRLHWNSIRFHVGPPPDFWLDIADECGIIVFNEFFIFRFREEWSTEELISGYREWMRDQWNHPSVVMWDASNETRADRLAGAIRAVRGDDLSNRAWDNGYNLPTGADDPVEDHPYLFHGRVFDMTELEQMTGAKSVNAPHPTGHAVIVNEYDWLWLQRDGSPTVGTRETWAKLLPANATAADRFELQAYLLGGLTEYWRAHRNAAGVLHFAYLSYSVPYSNSSDHFSDVEMLVLRPQFEDYIKEAFRPLGVYVNFWQSELRAGQNRRFEVMLVNDEDEPVVGQLELSIVPEAGGGGEHRRIRFEVSAMGQQTFAIDLRVPEAGGKAWLKAVAHPEPARAAGPTVSRRRLTVIP